MACGAFSQGPAQKVLLDENEEKETNNTLCHQQQNQLPINAFLGARLENACFFKHNNI